MDQADIEQLLRSFPLPSVPDTLDRRIMEDADRELMHVHIRKISASILSRLLDLWGFGYIAWIADRLAGRETEYQFTII